MDVFENNLIEKGNASAPSRLISTPSRLISTPLNNRRSMTMFHMKISLSASRNRKRRQPHLDSARQPRIIKRSRYSLRETSNIELRTNSFPPPLFLSKKHLAARFAKLLTKNQELGTFFNKTKTTPPSPIKTQTPRQPNTSSTIRTS